MTIYQAEINRIKRNCYSNKSRINTVVEARRSIEHSFDKALTLNLLSHHCFTSKYHLLRLFKRYYGQTPTQYLTEKRISIAKELLTNGYNVTDTCYEIGIESPSSFSTLFKMHTGVTPSQ
ncbi:hypothetical protein APR41_10625 [Salegentibacter salinarum]|uniref:HTH araC/xylS-type domain-containing protein n=1 Tax=Salegentibacter salinarum TaxID=447422 RepID=A0A2N0TNB2_9FLAO|nr:AraC family transcriptional regulator [Salegentibacter salinarum]PKD16233.1 hypothetical protein APR41_10625 [Salegentibacter salinarum]SKB67676.1 AraC-type DNA-binding protein [Salegentibacter salinarum]